MWTSATRWISWFWIQELLIEDEEELQQLKLNSVMVLDTTRRRTSDNSERNNTTVQDGCHGCGYRNNGF
ncbi:hypothetical protein G6F42_021786 [Rhizopus arrhizus]|nr:hypothetical protein G6F42_021786 [Rhizopus arrhizus]